jgi:hypothetical protein
LIYWGECIISSRILGDFTTRDQTLFPAQTLRFGDIGADFKG